MRETKRQKVNPNTGKDYSESSYTSLYNTFASFGLNEQNLIWMRYAGFLVLQGFLINAIVAGTGQVITLLCLSMFGIACSATWHILNFAGWLNQNVWFSIAAGLDFTRLSVPTPTRYWEIEHPQRPAGKIYHIAQSVPLILLFVYAIVAATVFYKMIGKWELAAPMAPLLFIVAVIIVRIVERSEYRERIHCEDNRPVS